MPATGKASCSILLLVLYCGRILVLLLMLLSLSGVRGSLHLDDAFTQRRAHYCGPKLSNTLAELCTKFNGMRKKSGTSMMAHNQQDFLDGSRLLADVQHDVQELRLLQDRSADTIYRALMSLQHLNSHALDFHRVRRQVVKECCLQSCTLETLRTYCAD